MFEPTTSNSPFSDFTQITNPISDPYDLPVDHFTSHSLLRSGYGDQYIQQYLTQIEKTQKFSKTLEKQDVLTGIERNLATFSVSSISSDPGNTINTAKPITVGSTPTSYTDSVGFFVDPNDYYRFSLSKTSQFFLQLTGISLFSNVDVQLLNSSGVQIAESKKWFDWDESLEATLNAGTYYIRVFPFYGSSNYKLTVSANVLPSNYNSISGYGLVNAAAAVGKALNQAPFADVPNLGGNNWGADLIKAPEVWNKGYTGRGITVAVVDTGVDYTHPDLAGNIWTNTREIAGNNRDDDNNGYVDDIYGWNFNGNNNNTMDVNGHGTHVAGTIAGIRNNIGVTGIAYNSKIMPVKALGDNGSGSYSAIAQGVRYAANNGAKVINLSLGGSVGSSELQAAIQYASSKGAIVVMAAGNSGGAKPAFPASYATNWGIAVGAVDRNKNFASFSNQAGGNPALAYVTAPGVSVYSTTPNNTYQTYRGTSMATPHVAGVVALMLSANPYLTELQIRDILTQTAA